jgi:hypothetical protein
MLRIGLFTNVAIAGNQSLTQPSSVSQSRLDLSLKSVREAKQVTVYGGSLPTGSLGKHSYMAILAMRSGPVISSIAVIEKIDYGLQKRSRRRAINRSMVEGQRQG